MASTKLGLPAYFEVLCFTILGTSLGKDTGRPIVGNHETWANGAEPGVVTDVIGARVRSASENLA